MAMNEQAYLAQLQALLPPGPAWTREPDANLTRILSAWAAELARIDARADDLLNEADPRTARELLPDWERVAGLPDPCMPAASTLEERRNRLVQHLTTIGDQSRAFYLSVAERIGYQGVTIEEFRPFMSGRSRCGDALNGPATVRFYWRVHVPEPRVAWFRAGTARCGDRLGAIRRAEDLECIFRRLDTRHTEVIFAYEGA